MVVVGFVVVVDVLGLAVVVVVLGVFGLPGLGLLPSPVSPELNAEPIGPVLIFEKMTVEPGEFFSTSADLPEEVEHVPRETSGLAGSVPMG